MGHIGHNANGHIVFDADSGHIAECECCEEDGCPAEIEIIASGISGECTCSPCPDEPCAPYNGLIAMTLSPGSPSPCETKGCSYTGGEYVTLYYRYGKWSIRMWTCTNWPPWGAPSPCVLFTNDAAASCSPPKTGWERANDVLGCRCSGGEITVDY